MAEAAKRHLKYITGPINHFYAGQLYTPGSEISLPVTLAPSVLWKGTDEASTAMVEAAKAKAAVVAARSMSAEAQRKAAEARAAQAEKDAAAAEKVAFDAVAKAEELSGVKFETAVQPDPGPSVAPTEQATTMSEMTSKPAARAFRRQT